MKKRVKILTFLQTLFCCTVTASVIVLPPLQPKPKGQMSCCSCSLLLLLCFTRRVHEFEWGGRRVKPRSEMAGWSGFTDEELHRLKRETSQEELKKETAATKVASGRGDRRGRPTNARVKARPIIPEKVWEERAGNGFCGLRRSTG